MKKFFSFKMMPLLTLSIFSLMGIGGVSASFIYAEANAESKDTTIKNSIGSFIYNQSSSLLKTNHLVECILNGTVADPSIGMNIVSSPINQIIYNRKHDSNGGYWINNNPLGSMDSEATTEMAKFFDSETSGMSFLISLPKGDDISSFIIYTTDILINNEYNEKIYYDPIYIQPIYKTTIQKGSDGIYHAILTEEGKAKTSTYIHYNYPTTYNFTGSFTEWQKI